MQAEVNGKVIQLSEAGWLENLDEWSEELAVQIAHNEKIDQLTDEHWDNMIAVNLTGVYNCTRAVAGSVLERGSGTIVNVASTAAAAK